CMWWCSPRVLLPAAAHARHRDRPRGGGLLTAGPPRRRPPERGARSGPGGVPGPRRPAASASGEFEAAVDGDDLPGDPGGGGVGEVDDPGGHLLRGAAAAERDAGGLLRL